MSQDNVQIQPDPPRRGRDFLVLTIGAIAVLTLLYLTGAIGLVEWVTAAIVMSTGALAFFVGSAPSPRKDQTSSALQTLNPASGAVSCLCFHLKKPETEKSHCRRLQMLLL